MYSARTNYRHRYTPQSEESNRLPSLDFDPAAVVRKHSLKETCGASEGEFDVSERERERRAEQRERVSRERERERSSLRANMCIRTTLHIP